MNIFNLNFNTMKINIIPPHESYIRKYITSEVPIAKNRIPLLVGTTAVAKSSTVKSVVSSLENEGEYGYRLVDIRTAFLDKNDIEGFTTKVKDSNNEYQIEMSPMRELLECTDEFLAYARDTLRKLKELDENSETVKKLIEIYEYKSKTPVLFFDEITRAEKSVRNAFTTIINQKQFLDYHMTIARIVAATNYAVDLPEEYSVVYTTEDIYDIASLERYETYIVKPEDIFQSWLIWAKDNIHPVVYSYLQEKGASSAYNVDTLIKNFSTMKNADPMSISEYPFPNYRSWEHVSMYMKSLSGNTVKETVINSLLGKNEVSVGFLESLRDAEYTVEYLEGDDFFYNDMKDCVLAGVPVMLAGPTSYGKTTRVSNLASELDAVLICINLATKDSTQIKGVPYPIPVEEAMLKGYDINLEELSDYLKELITDTSSYNVSGRTTEYIPDKYVREKILKAKREGKRVILFYDEVNRCDKTVLSSVFEAVSDHRAFGVDIDSDKLSIVCAANLGNSYGDVTDLDPAFSSRFAVLRRDNWTLKDVSSFKSYMKEKKYNEAVRKFIEDLPEDTVLEMLESTEDRTLVDAVPSMRAWDDLSIYLNKAPKNDPIHGCVLFRHAPVYDTKEQLLKVLSDNWIGYLQDMDIFDGEEKISMRSVVDECKDEEVCNLSLFLSKIEAAALQIRYSIIKAKLGPNRYTEQFFDYYNRVSGRTIIGVDVVEDIERIPEYVSATLYGIDMDLLPGKCSNLVNEVMTRYKESLTKEHYQSLVHSIHDVLQVKDIILRWWRAELQEGSEAFRSLMTLASKDDKEFTYKVLEDLGIPSGNYDHIINPYYDQRSNECAEDVSIVEGVSE